VSILEPLLVALDGSTGSRSAAAAARTLGRSGALRTILLHAIEAGGPGWGEEAVMQAMSTAAEMLNLEAARFTTPVEVRVVTGLPSEAIARPAMDFDAGLVLVTPRGRGALASILFGSVTRELLGGCRAPLLLVHHPLSLGRPVVCGVDAGPASPNVVAYARALAEALGSPLHVVHVVKADPSVAKNPTQYGIDPARWKQATDGAVRRVFDAIRPELPAGSVEAVRHGIAVDELAAYAEQHEAQLVVVGRKGESGNDVDSFFSVAFALASRSQFSTAVV